MCGWKWVSKNNTNRTLIRKRRRLESVMGIRTEEEYLLYLDRWFFLYMLLERKFHSVDLRNYLVTTCICTSVKSHAWKNVLGHLLRVHALEVSRRFYIECTQAHDYKIKHKLKFHITHVLPNTLLRTMCIGGNHVCDIILLEVDTAGPLPHTLEACLLVWIPQMQNMNHFRTIV